MGTPTSIPDGFKQCSRCKKIKPYDQFYKKKGKPNSHCKSCHNRITSDYKKQNQERTSAKNREYRQNNTERIRQLQKRWALNNAERKSETDRKAHKRHPERTRIRNRQNTRKRQARRKQVVIVEVPDIEAILFEIQSGKCLYCQKPLTRNITQLDHIVSLSVCSVISGYLGHIPENLALACSHCNISKRHVLLEDWLKWKYPDQMDEILHRVDRHIEMIRIKMKG